jgi:hypothetical protein
MTIENIIQQNVALAVKQLFNEDIEAASIALQETNKDFVGDITVVVFPYVRFAKRTPEQTGEALGNFLLEKTIEIKVCPSCAHRNERIKVTCEHCGKFLKDVEIQVENYLNSKEPETILLSFGSSKIIIKVTNNKTQSYGYKDFLEIRDFKTISSKHFIMYKDHLDIFIIDTSVNGTYINKTKLMGGVPLKINKHDILTLADIKFTIDDIN